MPIRCSTGAGVGAHTAGFYSLVIPRELGGLQADALTYLRVVELLAEGAGSVGWNLAAEVPTGYRPPRSAMSPTTRTQFPGRYASAPKYREKCDEVAARGYFGFAFR